MGFRKSSRNDIFIAQNGIIHIYQPLRSVRIWHKVSFWAEFSRSEFRVFLLLLDSPRLKNPSALPGAGGRIIGFIPFPRVLVLSEMQPASSRFWTRITVSISYDDNHYTMNTSKKWHYKLTCMQQTNKISISNVLLLLLLENEDYQWIK